MLHIISSYITLWYVIINIYITYTLRIYQSSRQALSDTPIQTKQWNYSRHIGYLCEPGGISYNHFVDMSVIIFPSWHLQNIVVPLVSCAPSHILRDLINAALAPSFLQEEPHSWIWSRLPAFLHFTAIFKATVIKAFSKLV